jgi:hypothetical protein
MAVENQGWGIWGYLEVKKEFLVIIHLFQGDFMINKDCNKSPRFQSSMTVYTRFSSKIQAFIMLSPLSYRQKSGSMPLIRAGGSSRELSH